MVRLFGTKFGRLVYKQFRSNTFRENLLVIRDANNPRGRNLGPDNTTLTNINKWHVSIDYLNSEIYRYLFPPTGVHNFESLM